MHRESHIIERLRLWQEQHQSDPVEMFAELPDSGKPGEVQNLLTRPSVGDHLNDAIATCSDDDLNSMKTLNDGQLIDPGSDRPFLQRGDLVELVGGNGNQQPILAIFIRDFETQSQFYTMQGKWVHRAPRTIKFSIPGFLDRTSVDELLPYLPLNEVSEELADRLHSFDSSVPREVGSSIIRKMLDFWNASDLAYRKHATQLDNVHDLMAHESEARFVALSEVATKVFGTLPKGHSRPHPILYAVHRALMQKDHGFTVDRRNHRITRVFEVRPKRETRLITKVRDWIRDYQEMVVASANRSEASSPSSRPQRASPIVDFVNKARSLILESRRTRTSLLSSGLGPSRVKLDPQTTEAYSLFQAVHSVAFSEADKCIIRFLEAWACYSVFSRYSVMHSLGPMVLRAIGLYEDRRLDQGTCWLFLQEIGVLAPWENRTVFHTQLALPGHAISAELDDIHRKTIEPETRLSLRDLKDTMQDFRHDWGDLEVFCIDEEDAKEIDDGISVQRVAGSSSENWVHVHVANPSAFIDPDHSISSYAAHLTETIYLPERTYTMLPKSWTQARLSLAPHRPVLTFSARINGEGAILENKVTSGIIRNVTYLTPSTVKQHLAEQLSSEVMTVITVGGQMPKRHKRDLQSSLSKAQIEKLQLLQSIGNKRRKVRMRRGAADFDAPSPDVSVYGGLYGMPIRLPSHGRSRFYEGDPVIQLRLKPWDPTVSLGEPTTSFVSNLMILACEVAAQWCKERNLPVIYRCTLQNPDLPDPTAFLRDHLWPSQDQYGNSPISVRFQYINLVGRAKASTAPSPHMALGVKSYTKVTSPLRRYGDLIVHWQIEAALRQEACTGASQFKIHDHSYLPFSKARLDSLIPGIESRERLVRAGARSSTVHWVVQLLFRALYFKEATLPETFELFVWTKGNLVYGNIVAGMLKGLGILVDMVPSALTETTGVDIGDWWEVKLGRVDVYLKKVSVEPVRLIKKAEGSMGKVAASTG
ncbi:MAG: hypothetical protein M1835_003315 [Candelina submexicana]|nr:MAG: hypothetical protein M1835_003315 [Candelina submexicana]